MSNPTPATTGTVQGFDATKPALPYTPESAFALWRSVRKSGDRLMVTFAQFANAVSHTALHNIINETASSETAPARELTEEQWINLAQAGHNAFRDESDDEHQDLRKNVSLARREISEAKAVVAEYRKMVQSPALADPVGMEERAKQLLDVFEKQCEKGTGHFSTITWLAVAKLASTWAAPAAKPVDRPTLKNKLAYAFNSHQKGDSTSIMYDGCATAVADAAIAYFASHQSLPSPQQGRATTGELVGIHDRTYIKYNGDVTKIVDAIATHVRSERSPTDNPWKKAIEEACIVNHLEWNDNDPAGTLGTLIRHENQIALDLVVSEEARKLRDTYKPATSVVGVEELANTIREAFWENDPHTCWKECSEMAKKGWLAAALKAMAVRKES